MLILRYFIVGKHSRRPLNELRGDNFCPVDQGEGSLLSSSVWCRSEGPQNYRRLLYPQPAMLLQCIKGSYLESTQHFSVRPLSLSIAPGVCHRGKWDLASEGKNILHEGAACELGAVVGDDPGRDPEAAHQSFQELDS